MPVVVQPRSVNVRKILIAGSVVLAAIIATYLIPKRGPLNPYWNGETMGTTYSVLIAGSRLSEKRLGQAYADVEALLDDIGRQMSTYRKDSEITGFNTSTTTAPVEVSSPFFEITGRAILLSQQLEGTFDPTIFPLVQRWGFGPDRTTTPPTEEEITALLKNTGVHHLEVLTGNRIRKKVPGLQLDLNGITPGAAADLVLELLTSNYGLKNVFVEIGGEICTAGLDKEERPWRIGIDVPTDGSNPGESLQKIIEVSGLGVATSGDYRNFKIDEHGNRISHIIDPRTGKPVNHNLASVTVLAPTATEADALATGLFVMAPEEGLAWVRQHAGYEALFIVRESDGTFREMATGGFEAASAHPATEPGTQP